MKKLLIILFTSLLLICASISVSAEDNHVYIDPDNPVLSSDEEAKLEEDLEHIHEDYDICIFLIYDQSISDDDIVTFNEQTVKDNHYSGNTVSFTINGNYYSIDAMGSQADLIESNSSELYRKFFETGYWYQGYIAFYQEVVRLINSQEYTSNVDKVTGNPNMADFSGNLSASEINDLNLYLKQLSNEVGIEIVGVLNNSLHGMTPQNYADDYLDYNGYPKDSILLMVSLDERDWYISTTGKAITYVTDYGIDYIADEAMSSLKSGDYYNAFEEYGDAAKAIIEQGKAGNIIDINNTMPETFGLTNILIASGIGLVVALITILILNGQLKSVHFERFARNYIVQDSFVITGYADMFINKSVTRTARPKHDDTSSGSSGGGSSFHTSSSGVSHGGHGGKF